MLQVFHNRKAFTTESIGISSTVVHYFGFETCDPKHFWEGVRDHFVLKYVVSGKGIFRSGNKEYHLQKGDYFLLRPGAQVFYQADSNDPWQYSWVAFSGGDIPYLFSNTGFKNGGDVFRASANRFEDSVTLFNTFFENMGHSSSFRLKLLNNLYSIFILLMEEIEESEDDGYSDESLLLSVTDYIQKNLGNNDLSVEEIAKRQGLSQSTLYRLFSDNLGTSPMKYIINLRMKRASHLLRTTKMSVSDISYEVGFSNPLYFSKYFKKFFKISPKQFVKVYANVKHPLEIDAFRPYVH